MGNAGLVAADAPDAEPREEDHAAVATEEPRRKPPEHDGVVSGMYAPLHKYLRSIAPSKQSERLTFEDIDNMLIGKNKLPMASRKLDFWLNDARGAQVKAWINAGFEVSEFNLEECWVRLVGLLCRRNASGKA
ncbi:DUF7662 domain-containing protein [Brucella anthropi]|uniref:DUF7662 domain-containing protein n=2 Tax=Brucella anthropi TaxID=529 RepID=UPI000F68C27E|nr:hypothetical protein [Brucella anthropi]